MDPVDQIRRLIDEGPPDVLTKIAAVLGYGEGEPQTRPLMFLDESGAIPHLSAHAANVTGEDDALRAAAAWLVSDHKRDSLRTMIVDGRPMTRAQLAERLLDMIRHARAAS